MACSSRTSYSAAAPVVQPTCVMTHLPPVTHPPSQERDLGACRGELDRLHKAIADLQVRQVAGGTVAVIQAPCSPNPPFPAPLPRLSPVMCVFGARYNKAHRSPLGACIAVHLHMRAASVW